MTLTRNERDELENNPEKYGLTDADLKLVLAKPRLYDPFGNPKGDPCPACGDADCFKAVSIVDEGHKIHEENHPEYLADRGRERP